MAVSGRNPNNSVNWTAWLCGQAAFAGLDVDQSTPGLRPEVAGVRLPDVGQGRPPLRHARGRWRELRSLSELANISG